MYSNLNHIIITDLSFSSMDGNLNVYFGLTLRNRAMNQNFKRFEDMKTLEDKNYFLDVTTYIKT